MKCFIYWLLFQDSEEKDDQYYLPEYYEEGSGFSEQNYEDELIEVVDEEVNEKEVNDEEIETKKSSNEEVIEKKVEEVNYEVVAAKCSKCECKAIEISSDGILNKAKEYNDTDIYGVTIENSKSYQFWENITYIKEKHRLDKQEATSNVLNSFKLVSVDIHSSKMWEKYEKFRRNTNLKYKDLLGTYNLFSCSQDYTKNISPVYKRVLSDGTEAYLFHSKLGNSWEVTQKRYNIGIFLNNGKLSRQFTGALLLMFHTCYVNLFQVGPYVHSLYANELRWDQILEVYIENSDTPKTTKASRYCYKSESWIYGDCTDSCADNCTNHAGRLSSWSYIQKSVNPIQEDVDVLDSSLRVMCKGRIG